MLQLELARQGLLTGNWASFAIAAQGIFTLGLIAWLGLSLTRQRRKGFLRMSCVSKKVHFQGRWMTVERYLAEHHNIVVVSHAMTPEESQAWLADAEEYLRQEIPSLDRLMQTGAFARGHTPCRSFPPRELQQSAAA